MVLSLVFRYPNMVFSIVFRIPNLVKPENIENPVMRCLHCHMQESVLPKAVGKFQGHCKEWVTTIERIPKMWQHSETVVEDNSFRPPTPLVPLCVAWRGQAQFKDQCTIGRVLFLQS
jgi:hypothetical protein